MSWRVPVFRVRSGYVIDCDDMNANFQAVTEEAAGRLNEHNWKAAAFAGKRNECAEDAAYRIASARQYSAGIMELAINDATNYQIAQTGTWDTITPLTAEIVDSPGGRLWVMSSFQYRCYTSLLNPNYGLTSMGAMFALRVNGQVIPESILGSGDLSNDKLKALIDLGLGGYHEYATPGVTGLFMPLLLEWMLDVPPGNHTIEVVSMVLVPGWANDYYSVGIGETIVVEASR